MRTYAKNHDLHPRTKPYSTTKQRAERFDTEWDIRIDVNHELGPSDIQMELEADMPGLHYVLIGNVEVPDNINAGPTGSNGDHVHIALVFKEPVNRARALRACRPAKVTDEYAVPRNRKFSYAGWLAHHTKASFKRDLDAPTIYWEEGELPEDDLTSESKCWQVAKILKKFATADIKARFKHVYAKLDEFKQAKLNAAIESVVNLPVASNYLLP